MLHTALIHADTFLKSLGNLKAKCLLFEKVFRHEHDIHLPQIIQ